ncbi:MAG: hypothetical protein OXT07_07235 [bacterium]|nr:hypothetical protein [bacterium]
MTEPQPQVSYIHAEDMDFAEVKSQQHADGRRVSVWLKLMELTQERAVFHTRYDPGLVLERHGHNSDHFIFVIEGEVTFDEEVCRPGTLIKLPHLATFGPIKVGDEGAEILEIYFGDSRPAPADKAEHAAILKERGITELPHPPLDLPDWFGPRND